MILHAINTVQMFQIWRRRIWITISKDVSLSNSIKQARKRQHKILALQPTERFLELPPDHEQFKTGEDARDDAASDYYKLRDELGMVHSLLIGRFVGFVLFYYEQNQIPENEIPHIGYTVKKKIVKGHLKWYIFIRTRHPHWYQEILNKYKNWLAIDIELEDVSRINPEKLKIVSSKKKSENWKT